MCESQEIRYVHRMEHPQYSEVLECGRICSGHLEENRGAAERREVILKNVAARRSRWLDRQWTTSSNGNPMIRTNGFMVTVFRRRQYFRVSAYDAVADDTRFPRESFEHEDEAKLAGFDAMMVLLARRESGK